MAHGIRRLNSILVGLVLTISAAAVYLSALSDVPFFTRGEAREALVVQSMYQQNNFALPLRNGIEVPSKPPMFHWSAALSSRTSSGSDAWQIRLPSALYAALAIGALAGFAMRFAGLKIACLSALLLGSSFEWMRAASRARVDMTFAFFLGLTLYLGFHLIQSRTNLSRWRYWLVVLATGLAAAGSTLAKGPAGLLLPFMVLGALAVFKAARERRKSALTFLPLLEAFLLALVLAAAWYLYAYLLHGEKFLYRQILFENFARVVEMEGKEVGHKKPFFYSLIYFFTAFQPWALFLGFPLLWLWDKRRELVHRDDVLFGCLWVLAFLAAVTISVSKRQVYFLPALPPLAYLSALALSDREWFASRLGRYKRGLRYLFLAAALLFFVLAVLPLLLHWLPASFSAWLGSLFTPEEPSLFALIVASMQSFSAVALLAAASLSSWFFAQGIERNRALFPIGLMAVVALAISLFVQQRVFELEADRIGAFEFAQEIDSAVEANEPLYQYKGTFFAVNYYTKRDIPVLKASSRVLSDEHGYLLAWQGHLEELRMLGVPIREVLKSSTRAANGDGPLVLLYFGSAEQAGMFEEEASATEESALKEADGQRPAHQPSSTEQLPEVPQSPGSGPERDQSALDSTESLRPLPAE